MLRALPNSCYCRILARSAKNFGWSLTGSSLFVISVNSVGSEIAIRALLSRRHENDVIKIDVVEVNLCQKLLFLHQLTHNMTKDCPLNYEFSTWKLQAQNMLCTNFCHIVSWCKISASKKIYPYIYCFDFCFFHEKRLFHLFITFFYWLFFLLIFERNVQLKFYFSGTLPFLSLVLSVFYLWFLV